MPELSRFFLISQPDPSMLVIGQYNIWLVLLSLVIAVGASYMALTLAAAARRATSVTMVRMHLITGALSLGIGVWSMHFIGMLAFELCTPVDYDPGITVLSALPSILAGWITLNLLSRHEVNWQRLIAGGLAVGAGIGSMHYLGMAAMTLGPSLRYEPWLFTASLVVAVGLGTLALWISFGLRRRLQVRGYRIRLMAGAVMGLAIAGMHYTAMEAARFVGTPMEGFDPDSQQHYALAVAIAGATTAISLLVGAINALARYRSLLKHSQEMTSELQAMFDTAVDGIIKISERGIIQSFNRSAERIFGYRETEVVGRNVSMLMPEPHRSAHDGYLRNYLRTGEAKIIGTGREVTALHKDGHTIPVRLSIGESRLGGISNFVGVITDITEAKAMERALREAKEQAEQAAAAKGTFLANMSHEIRTPMNAIIGFSELMLDTGLKDQQRRNLDIIHSSARNLLALLNDILDTAKLDNGTTELEQRDFSLRRLCDQLVATQSLAAQRKGLDLKLDYQPGAGDFFCGDALRIQQVVLNLLNNAVKFTEQGQVTLSVTRDPEADHGIIIRVADTGIGIPQDRLDKIFEPFSQADSSTTRRFGGTGLGTTIARQLTELMGGSISVASTPGEGSCFTVCLPLQPGNPVADETVTRDETPLPPMTILVADDVTTNLELLAAVLEPRGHRVITAGNGEEAVREFRCRHFDLVLLDVQMPVLNGHEACVQMRQHERDSGRRRTPVLALTASVLAEDREYATQAGMDGFAGKPINLAELTAEIARVTGQPAGPQAPQAPASSVSKDTDSLPAIDQQQVDILWGDADKHRQRLRQFLNAEENQAERLAGLVRQSDPAAAGELHRIRGVAGSLCLPALFLILEQIETHFLATDPIPADKLDDLKREMQRLHRLVQPQPVAHREPETPGEPDRAALLSLVSELDHGAVPEDSFRHLAADLPEALAEAVTRALENFEPDTAADLLRQFLQETEL